MAETTSWAKALLMQHVDLLAGFAFKSSQFTDDATDIPLVKGADVQQGYIDWPGCKRWPRSSVHKLEKFWLREGDVVLAMDRPWVPSGLKWAWVRQGSQRSLLVQRVARLRGKDGLLTDYLRYLIGSPQFTDYIRPIVTGVNVPHVSGSQILGFSFLLPPFPTQRRIAAILSAYDDLIENNLRRIKILEEMAQNLYREWFVKFRFPGHQHARFTASPLGRIPEGWEVKAFTEVAHVLSGGTPKTSVQEYWGGTIPFFAPKDAPESFYVTNTEKTITETGLRKCSSRLYPKDTIFITARGTVGKVVMPSRDMAMNQSCYALRGKEGISQLYLFLATREQVDYLKKNTGGATFDTIIIDTFRRMLVAKPDNETVSRFSQMISSGMELILNILKKNTALRRTRDLLLPRLISGEVDVSKLDIVVCEQAGA